MSIAERNEVQALRERIEALEHAIADLAKQFAAALARETLHVKVQKRG